MARCAPAAMRWQPLHFPSFRKAAAPKAEQQQAHSLHFSRLPSPSLPFPFPSRSPTLSPYRQHRRRPSSSRASAASRRHSGWAFALASDPPRLSSGPGRACARSRDRARGPLSPGGRRPPAAWTRSPRPRPSRRRPTTTTSSRTSPTRRWTRRLPLGGGRCSTLAPGLSPSVIHSFNKHTTNPTTQAWLVVLALMRKSGS